MRTSKMILLTALVLVLALATYIEVSARPAPVAESFQVNPGGSLVVDIDHIGADIHVKVWSKSEVTVRVEGLNEDYLEDLSITESGNTVRVEFDGRNGWGSHRNARLYINVPAEFNLDLGTSGGDIDVAGDLEGTVRAGTAGGDIEVGDVDGGVELKTAGGDLVAGRINGDAKLNTSGGDVDVVFVAGKLNIGTSGGDITIGEVEGDLKASTAGGDIRCEKSGGGAVVQTSGGDIDLGRLDGPVTAKTSGGDIEIQGAKGQTVARTAGGDVNLLNITGYVDAVTSGGDIEVDLDPTNAGSSNLESKGGTIILYLPGDAEVTVEAEIRLRGWSGDDDEYDIMSDFKAEDSDRDKRHIWARYAVNGGGKLISIETVNGNIEIRKK